AAVFTLGALPAFGDQAEPRFRSNPFKLGVASGDPFPDGVVLWTRLDGKVHDEAGVPESSVPVRWEVAEDDRFRRIVRKGSQTALRDLGYSVHAEVDGLRPARHYWYRFIAGGELSATGRTRTAPLASATLDRF